MEQPLAADPLFRCSADTLYRAVLRCVPLYPALLRCVAALTLPSEGLKIWSSQGPVPVGWFLGRPSKLSSYLVCEEYKKAGLPPIKWWSDLYCDDVPHWRRRPGGTKDEGMLCLPYSYDNNDYKFSQPAGWRSPKIYSDHLIAAFDELWAEAERTGTDKMMTIGLHCRVIGKPARIGAVERFLDHLKAKGAWVTTREAIADHWAGLYPYDPETAW